MANGVPFERHTREWWGRLTDEQRARGASRGVV